MRKYRNLSILINVLFVIVVKLIKILLLKTLDIKNQQVK